CNDGGGDGGSMTLLAKVENDVGEIALRSNRHNIGSGWPIAAHAHVERSIVPEREPALGRIELHGRDPEVEDHPVRRRDPETECDSIERSEPAFDQGEAAAGRVGLDLAARDRTCVAIDADDPGIGSMEDCGSIAA